MIALLLLSSGYATNASAYPASGGTSMGPATQSLYQYSKLIGGPWTGPKFNSQNAACNDPAAVTHCATTFPGKTCTNFRYISGAACWADVSAGVGQWQTGYVQGAGTGCPTGSTNDAGTCRTPYTCPNGGTLSGSTCTCPSGYTDTGTACTAPACPMGKKPDGVGGCVDKCPVGQHSTERVFPPGMSSACGPRNGLELDQRSDAALGTYYKEADGTTDALLQCRYKATSSTIVCDALASGDNYCYSSNARITDEGGGAYCPPASHPSSTEVQRQPKAPAVDPTPSTCDVGDNWCKNSTGTCGAGFIGGTFNGMSICVKQGVSVGVVPQGTSVSAPPTGSDAVTPPTSLPPAESPLQPGEVLRPADRVVVGVGPVPGSTSSTTGTTGTTSISGTVGVTGGVNITGGQGGTGSKVQVEAECGVAGKPACNVKVDETGTPTDTSALDGHKASIEEALKSGAGSARQGMITDALKAPDEVGKLDGGRVAAITGDGGSCTAIEVVAGRFTLDPCGDAGQMIRGLFGFFWAASTFGFAWTRINSALQTV